MTTTEEVGGRRLHHESAHIVKFYQNEDALFPLVGEYLADGGRAGDPLVIIARSQRHKPFTRAMRAHGLDPDDHSQSGRLTILDAEMTLARFMVGSMPDEERFMRHIGGLVGGAIERFGSVRAYGEMVDVLWQSGNPEAAVRLEELWNLLGERHTFALFCAYPMGNFLKESDRKLFDVVCATHTHVLPAEDAADHDGELDRVVAALQQRTQALETEIRHRDEVELRLRDALAARREAEAELQDLYDLAQQANRAKDQFLATLSHELRTPLTAILGWARMLTLGGLDEQTVHTALLTIERSARAQTALVDDLLDLSRVVSGKLTLQHELVDLASIVDEAVQTCTLAAEAKQIDITVAPQRERVVVLGDPGRLRQVIWNLVTNAIKYSNAKDRIEIRIERANGCAEVTVRDTGRGIDPMFLGHVFEPFRQADSSTTRQHGGLGLGLAIVKKLTELHGGTIEAKSDGAGQGSTFVVSLPLIRTNTSPEPAEAADANVNLHDRRILVVEDDASTADLLAAVLQRFGADVDTASTASAALSRIREVPPDAVVADIALPDDDGFSLLAALRAIAGSHGIPVIAVTGLSHPNTEERLKSAGFNTWMRKPVDPVEFARTIANLVDRHAY